MKEIFQAAVESLELGQPVAMLTIVHASGSTPRHSASNMLVRADGTFLGTIGGGTMELSAIKDARAAIAEKKSRLVDYNLAGQTNAHVFLTSDTETNGESITLRASGSRSRCE